MKRLLKPILFLPLLVILSRSVEEAYPLSHFPMYATLDTEPVWYVYLADAGTGQPLPMEHTVGIRPAAAKKIFRTRLRKRAEQDGLKKDNYRNLPKSTQAEVGKKFLTYLRARHENLKEAPALPNALALMAGEITLIPGEKPTEKVRAIYQDRK